MKKNTESGNHYVLIIISLVLGIISLFSCFIPIKGITVAGLGLFFGIIGMGSKKRGIPLAVLLICCAGLLLSVINIGLGLDTGTAGQLFPLAGKNTPVVDSFRITPTPSAVLSENSENSGTDIRGLIDFPETSTPVVDSFRISPPPGTILSDNSENLGTGFSDLIEIYASSIDVYPPYDWEIYILPENSTNNSVYAYYKKAVSAYDLEYIEAKTVGDQAKMYSFGNIKHTVKIIVMEKTDTASGGLIVFYDEGSLGIPQSNTTLPTATKVNAAPKVELTATVQKKQIIEDNADKCYEWSEITLRDVGTTKCVYGTVIKQRNEPTALYLIFSPDYDDFYFISYGNWYYKDVEGNCAMAYGEIRQLGQAPVMVIDNRMLRYCE